MENPDNEWINPGPRVVSVFNVWEIRDNNWKKPHYPSYEVSTQLVGSAFSLECAQRLVREIVAEERKCPWRSNLHSVRVTEQPVGQLYGPFSGSLSGYIYDRDGRLLDKRTTPEGLRLELDQKKAHNRMDRVRISFLRLAGQHMEGRGYRLKRVMDHWKRPVEPETWKF